LHSQQRRYGVYTHIGASLSFLSNYRVIKAGRRTRARAEEAKTAPTNVIDTASTASRSLHGEARAPNKRVYRDIGREIKLKTRVLLPIAPPPKWPLDIAGLLHLLGATSGGVHAKECSTFYGNQKFADGIFPIVNSVTAAGPKFIAD